MLTAADRAPLMISSRWRPLFRWVQLLPRIFDHRDRRDFDIGKLAVRLLEAADIDVLNDVPGLGVGHDRAARAVRVLPPLEEAHRLIGGELSRRRLEQVENRHHSVPGIDGEEVGDGRVGIFTPPSRQKGSVRRPDSGGRIISGSDQTQWRIAHRRELLVGQQVLCRRDLNAGFAQADIPDRIHQSRRLCARYPEEHDVGLGVPDALHERREIGIVRGNADRADDLAAAVGKALGEGSFRIMPRDKVADRGIALLPALLRRPFPDRIALLPERERHSRDIGRDARNCGAAGGDADQQRHLRLGGQWCYRRSHRRQNYAGQELHVLAGDQLLSQPLADFRIGGIVAPYDFDLYPRRQILLVLLHVQVDGFLRLVRGLRDKAGVATDVPDLYHRLCRRQGRRYRENRSRRAGERYYGPS